jgi:hypothetical protein
MITHTKKVYLFALPLFVTLFFVGCAPRYEISEAPQKRQEERKQAISQSIEDDLFVTQKYINFGFGDEYIVKPPSFKPLDSLYEVKYNESRFGGLTRNRAHELNQQIEAVRNRVEKDTVLFKYEIAHLFGIEEKDSIQFFSSTYMLNSELDIEKVSLDFFFKEHKRYARQFSEYMRNESFLYSSYTPSQEEIRFYSFYEAGLNQIKTAVRKGKFIAHMLRVMRAAAVQQTLNSELVIKQLILNDITASVIDYKSIKWSPVYTKVDEENNLVGYFVDHEWSYKNAEQQEFQLKRRFILDVYFMTTDIYEIDELEME